MGLRVREYDCSTKQGSDTGLKAVQISYETVPPSGMAFIAVIVTWQTWPSVVEPVANLGYQIPVYKVLAYGVVLGQVWCDKESSRKQVYAFP